MGSFVTAGGARNVTSIVFGTHQAGDLILIGLRYVDSPDGVNPVTNLQGFNQSGISDKGTDAVRYLYKWATGAGTTSPTFAALTNVIEYGIYRGMHPSAGFSVFDATYTENGSVSSTVQAGFGSIDFDNYPVGDTFENYWWICIVIPEVTVGDANLNNGFGAPLPSIRHTLTQSGSIEAAGIYDSNGPIHGIPSPALAQMSLTASKSWSAFSFRVPETRYLSMSALVAGVSDATASMHRYVGLSASVTGISEIYAKLAGAIKGTKDVLFKIFTSAGVFIRTWPDITYPPRFNWPINSGHSALTVTLPRQWGEIGEQGEFGATVEDVALDNKVEIWITDNESGPDGQLIYQGTIEEYEVDDSAESAEVTITIVPVTTNFADRWIADVINFVMQRPDQMVDYLIDNDYIADVTADPANGEVGDAFDLEITKMKLGQALELIRLQSGSKAFYRLNADKTLTFAEFSTDIAPDHELVIGKHVTSAKWKRSQMHRKGRVFVYGEGVETSLDDDDYDDTIDPRDLVFSSKRIIDVATANRIALALLEYWRLTPVEGTIVVPDNTVNDSIGYDIESLKPGQTIRVRNPNYTFGALNWGDGWVYGDGTLWGGTWAAQVQSVIVIAEVDYQYDKAILRLSQRPSGIPEEFVSVSDRLLLEETA